MYCTKCKLDKDNVSFRERSSLKRGYQSWCRECENTVNRSKYIPAIKVEKVPKPYDSHEAFCRMLKSRYGITYDTYFKMYTNQNGKCAICEAEFVSKRKTFVDHNHTNGNVRALLCPKCNTILGHSGDSIKVLETAILYLKKFNEVQ